MSVLGPWEETGKELELGPASPPVRSMAAAPPALSGLRRLLRLGCSEYVRWVDHKPAPATGEAHSVPGRPRQSCRQKGNPVPNKRILVPNKLMGTKMLLGTKLRPNASPN